MADGATAQIARSTPTPTSVARLVEFLARVFGPDAVAAPRASKTCLYTLTPDRDFVLDAVPGHPEVLVALGAAHGFKFASWFGGTCTIALGTGAHARPLAVPLRPPGAHRPG